MTAYLHGRHEVNDVLFAELQDTVEDTNLIIPQRLLSLSVELQKRPAAQSAADWGGPYGNALELSLLVSMCLAFAQDIVE